MSKLSFKSNIKNFLIRTKIAKYFGLPHNVENTKEWLSKKGLDKNYLVMFPSEKVHLNPPKSITGGQQNLFSIKDNGEPNLEINLKETFVAQIPGGKYVSKFGSCLTEDNILLEDVSIEFGAGKDKKGFEFSIFSAGLPKEVYYDKTVAVLDSAGDYNYFHWVINILPKIDFFERSKIDIDYYVVSTDKPFQKQSLEFINIPPHKIISKNKSLKIKAKNLVVAGIVSTALLNPESLEVLKNKFNVPKSLERRIFITRRNALQGRRLDNEEGIIALIKNYGFEIFELELLSFREQVELFSAASIVLAPHGGGLTNMIFCHPQVKIIELFNPNYMQNVYMILASLMNFDYYYLTGEGYNKDGNHYDCSGNMQIDLIKLEKTLQLAGVNRID